MSKEKFTKGNWVAKTANGSIKHAVVYLSDKGGFDISNAPDCIANAHLIASSPEMYEMLNIFVQLVEGDRSEDFLYKFNEVKEILAKARGGQ